LIEGGRAALLPESFRRKTVLWKAGLYRSPTVDWCISIRAQKHARYLGRKERRSGTTVLNAKFPRFGKKIEEGWKLKKRAWVA